MSRPLKFTLRYGIDAPFWVGFLIFLGVGVSVASAPALPNSLPGLISGLFNLLLGLWMFFYSTSIKVAHRHVILNLAHAHAGDELLDVGTGRGLLAIAAAQRGCKVKAIDIWSQWDLGGNGRDALQKNIESEGVEHIDIVDGDVRDMPFQDESFDVIVSNYVIHNIKSADDRARAIREMWRVLRPNGRLAISDINRTAEYIWALNTYTDCIKTKRFFYTFPFSRIVVFYKQHNH